MTNAGVPETTLYMVHLRASQITGCSMCVDIHSRELKQAGEHAERIHTVAVWRETPYFSEAERAALALTEAATRLADRPDPIPDEIWDEAARHYGEQQLTALVVAIATINAFNCLNAATRQITGQWGDQIAKASAKVSTPAEKPHGDSTVVLRAERGQSVGQAPALGCGCVDSSWMWRPARWSRCPSASHDGKHRSARRRDLVLGAERVQHVCVGDVVVGHRQVLTLVEVALVLEQDVGHLWTL